MWILTRTDLCVPNQNGDYFVKAWEGEPNLFDVVWDLTGSPRSENNPDEYFITKYFKPLMEKGYCRIQTSIFWLKEIKDGN